jgi:hypothetical protein
MFAHNLVCRPLVDFENRSLTVTAKEFRAWC